MLDSKLAYRRQYILGDKFVEEFSNWQRVKISNNLFLTAHPDLEVNHDEFNDNSLTVLGFIIDPEKPHYTNRDIIKSIIMSCNTFDDVLSATYHYSGRWVMIWVCGDETKIFHDPCGMRQVFYTTKDDTIWCGAQPNILAEILNLQLDKSEDLQEYINSKKFKNNENSWFGNRTLYSEVKHLMPNHYLDVNYKEVERYWVDEETVIDLDSIVKESSKILKKSLEAISKRYKLMLPITAGWDSRTLLAASKDISSEVFYYISTMNVLNQDHMDIAIPRKISSKLNLDFSVIDNLPSVTNETQSLIKNNITLGRIKLPKTLTIQYHLENNQGKINIGGNGSEIVRSYYGNKHPNQVDGQYLAHLVGLSEFSYVVDSLNNWTKDARKIAKKHQISIVDLFYWEQRMGNWGALYQAEQDIAIEEFCPFNNRKLIMMMLKSEDKYRSSPNYILYRKIIENLWVDVLSEPINPINLVTKVKMKLVGMIPIQIRNKLKSLLIH